jgi:uncharacterized OB-fold protein
MSTRPKQPRCKQCGRPVPPRYRKCDECIVGGPTERARSLGKREKPVGLDANGSVLVQQERDVVLTCGHIVSSKVRLGDPVRCPLHKRMERSARAHDGYEVPAVRS